MNKKIYEGLDEDLKNGMTYTARIVLDAKVFGLIEDDETCTGWNLQGILALYDEVSAKWEEHGLLPSHLPEELLQRHTAIYEEAVATAKGHGWDPEDSVKGEG